ncbi:hypothetical protein [Cupriavidus taiwanensis]|uniref:Uncharacterized protein n=1 Tax=Cupriavidus taiwanensis TaxID=164546 RepID=A0A375IYH8_9BURK|nr:hypothetical protein [Cupriavidus taiwanensis]SPR97391.1 hypothetical protein CBM2634_A170121 [Cupriavidus taiwanensis]
MADLKPGCCHKCGLPRVDNPHPDAGKPERMLDVGCPKECLPCTVLSRHQWAQRAYAAEKRIRELEARAAMGQVPIELAGVMEEVERGKGFWTPCTGCYDTEDGRPTQRYSHSEIFCCELGSGCSECGGIGAVWDDTDYEAMARLMVGQEATPPTTSADDARDAALDEAATAVEQHDKNGREWVPGSLWDQLTREAAGRIRALRTKKEKA